MNTAQANEPPPTQEFPLNEIKRPGLIAANNNNVPHLRSPSFWRNKKAANMSIQKRLLQKKLLKWVAIPTAIAVLLGLIIFLAVWFGALHRVSSSSPSTSILYIAPPINYKICILFIALSANNGIEYKLNQNASEYALLPSLSASWISAQSFGRISLSGIVNTTSYADVFDWVNVTVSSIDCNQYQDWANQAAQSILHNNVYNLILLITSGKDNCGVIYPSTSSNIALASYSYILSTPLIFGKLLASMTNFIGSADNTLNCLDYTQRSSPLTTSSENCNSVQLMDCTDIV